LFVVTNIIAIYNTANSTQFMMVFPGMHSLITVKITYKHILHIHIDSVYHKKLCTIQCVYTRNNKYCHNFGESRQFRLVNGFIKLLQLINTINFSTITNSHMLKFATECTKSIYKCSTNSITNPNPMSNY
jgi:hypothetical protein